MKTSEFKKIVEENGYTLCELKNEFQIYFDDDARAYVSKIYKYKFNIYTYIPKNLGIAILDYTYTPLEERKEEKKYQLIMPKDFVYNSKQNVLRFNQKGMYYFLGSEDKMNSKVEDELLRKCLFTQKEIDEMPFDTSFFIKEEV